MTDPIETDLIEIRRKKAQFRAWHRGTREMDLLIGRFAEKFLPDCDEAGLIAFESLLLEQDPDVYDWANGRLDVPAHMDAHLIKSLQDFTLSGDFFRSTF